MDCIKITKIEYTEFITINGESYDNKVKECLEELAVKQADTNNYDPFLGLYFSIAYTILRSKLFKEN